MCSASQDHPRSRGVYVGARDESPECGGSSPLARGLLVLNLPGVRKLGIIPARAGFTHRFSRSCTSSPDHPRSRGVYAQSICAPATMTGSSPLARGLRPRPTRPHSGRGIIPARAGFTTRPAGSRTGGGDHPRSRGVYPTLGRHTDRVVGSSPLARGLLVMPLV